MKQHDKNPFGVKISPHSPNSLLRKVIETKILLLRMTPKKWEKISDALSSFGVLTDGKSPERIAKELQGYAQRELCPYNDYLRIDTDDVIIDDQGKQYTPSNAPRNESYLKSILFWIANSEWMPSDNQNTDAKEIWPIEDWPKISAELFLYSKLKKRSNVKDIERDVRNLKSPDQLFEQIRSYVSFDARANRLMDKADELFKGKVDEAEIVFESSEIKYVEGIARPKVRIIHVKTEAASRAYGKDTRWCTAYQDRPTLFSSYDNLFIFHLADGRRAQLYVDEVSTWFDDDTGQYYQNRTVLKDTQDIDISLAALSLHDDVGVLNFVVKRILDKVYPESFFGHIEKISGVSIFALPSFARGLEESASNICKYIRDVAAKRDFVFDVTHNAYWGWGIHPHAWHDLNRVEFYSHVKGCEAEAQNIVRPLIENLRKFLEIVPEIPELSLECSSILLKVVRGEPDLEKVVIQRITTSEYSVSEHFFNREEDDLAELFILADNFKELDLFLSRNFGAFIKKACSYPKGMSRILQILRANNTKPSAMSAEAQLLEDIPGMLALSANDNEWTDTWKATYAAVYRSEEEKSVYVMHFPELVRGLMTVSTSDGKLSMIPLVYILNEIKNNEDYLAIFKSELVRSIQNLKGREVSDANIDLLSPLFMVIKLREIDPKLADFLETELAPIAGVEFLRKMIIDKPDKSCVRYALYNNLPLARYKGVFADIPELIKSKALRSLGEQTDHVVRLFYGSRDQPYRIDDVDTEYLETVCEKGDAVLAKYAFVAVPYLEGLRAPLVEAQSMVAKNASLKQYLEQEPLRTAFSDEAKAPVLTELIAESEGLVARESEVLTIVPITAVSAIHDEPPVKIISDQFNLAQNSPPNGLTRLFQFVSRIFLWKRNEQSNDRGENNEPKPPE